jgi:hypothetical protein
MTLIPGKPAKPKVRMMTPQDRKRMYGSTGLESGMKAVSWVIIILAVGATILFAEVMFATFISVLIVLALFAWWL